VRQRGIGKFLVVVNRELTERFVAGDKFPPVCGSESDDRTYVQVRDDETIKSELKLSVQSVRVAQGCSVRSRRLRLTRKLGMLERVLPGESALADQAFSQLYAITAHYEDLAVALIVARPDPPVLGVLSHCPAPACWNSSPAFPAGATTAALEPSLTSFTMRQTLAREMLCFLAT
jgi:hypothetical protein